MAILVIGGHSRNVGKTSVVAGLISALPERQWTAVKITQFGHGICSVNGKSCHCACDEHTVAISEERDRGGKSDTSRFLAAGAERSLWVRTKQGFLAEAMPSLRRRIADASNVILESNSVIRFLRPDLYLSVLDYQTADFKASAREFLDRADVILLHQSSNRSGDRSGSRPDGPAKWSDVSLKLLDGKTIFRITPPEYVTGEIVEWVRQRIN